MEVAVAAIGSAVSAAAAAPITTAATLIGGYAAYQSAVASNKAADANARSIAQEAELTKQQGLEAEVKQRQKVAAIVGEQKVAYGASGVETGAGTPMDVQEDTKKLGDADALTIRANTAMKVKSLQSQQAAYLSSKTSPWLAAGQTVLTDLAMGNIFRGINPVSKTATASKAATSTMRSNLQFMKNYGTGKNLLVAPGIIR